MASSSTASRGSGWDLRVELEILIANQKTVKIFLRKKEGYLGSKTAVPHHLVSPDRGYSVAYESQWYGVRHFVTKKLNDVHVKAYTDETDQKPNPPADHWNVKRRINVLNTPRDIPVHREMPQREYGMPSAQPVGDETPEQAQNRHLDKWDPTFFPITVTSPWLAMGEQSLDEVAIVCQTIRSNCIPMAHTNTRLRVQLRRRNGKHSNTRMKKLAAFLWYVSPGLDGIHAPWCDARSVYAPGIDLMLTKKKYSVCRLTVPEWGLKKNPPSRRFPLVNYENRHRIQRLPLPSDPKFDQERSEIFSRKGKAIRSATNNDPDPLSFFSLPPATFSAETGRLSALPREQVFKFLPAYNFESFFSSYTGEKIPFIEFRQHTGTADGVAVINWIRLCVALCDVSNAMGPQDLDAFCDSIMGPSLNPTGFVEFIQKLEEIGLTEVLAYYKDRGRNPLPEEHKSGRLWHDAIALDINGEINESVNVGIELEFLAPYILSGNRRVDRKDDRKDKRDYVLEGADGVDSGEKAIMRKGSEVIASHHLFGIQEHIDPLENHEGISRMTSETAISQAQAQHRILHSDYRPHYQAWCLGIDQSVKSDLDENRKPDKYPIAAFDKDCGMELRTPVLRSRSSTYLTVSDVLHNLTNKMHLFVNHTTGLHVHVGRDTAWPLLTIKRIATFTWLHEDILFNLCHPSRRANLNYSGPVKQTCRLAKMDEDHGDPSMALECLQPDTDFHSNNFAVQMAEHIPPDQLNNQTGTRLAAFKPNTLANQLWAIWKADTIDMVSYMLRPEDDYYDRAGVSFIGAAEEEQREDRRRGTVEFRMYEGTLDPERVIHWALLLSALTTFCDEASNREFSGLLSCLASEKALDAQRVAQAPFLADGSKRIYQRNCVAQLLRAIDGRRWYEYWEAVIDTNKDLADAAPRGELDDDPLEAARKHYQDALMGAPAVGPFDKKKRRRIEKLLRPEKLTLGDLGYYENAPPYPGDKQLNKNRRDGLKLRRDPGAAGPGEPGQLPAVDPQPAGLGAPPLEEGDVDADGDTIMTERVIRRGLGG